MCLSSAGYSLWRVALTMATSRMEIEVWLLTLAMLMLVWSLTAPRAFRILLGAIACDDDYDVSLGFIEREGRKREGR